MKTKEKKKRLPEKAQGTIMIQVKNKSKEAGREKSVPALAGSFYMAVDIYIIISPLFSFLLVSLFARLAHI